jgi:hypothetical protein
MASQQAATGLKQRNLRQPSAAPKAVHCKPVKARAAQADGCKAWAVQVAAEERVFQMGTFDNLADAEDFADEFESKFHAHAKCPLIPSKSRSGYWCVRSRGKSNRVHMQIGWAPDVEDLTFETAAAAAAVVLEIVVDYLSGKLQRPPKESLDGSARRVPTVIAGQTTGHKPTQGALGC